MIIGIVGKANTGKSTFFKALTLAEVAIAPYPFTTLEKNEGIGFVKTDCVEKEFKVKCNPKYGYCTEGKRFVPVKLIDVAGLVPGAHKGKGRGNEFLDDLREADVLIHILDASGLSDEQGKPTQNYDVCFDVKFLQEEIDLWLYEIIGKNWKHFTKKMQEGKKLSKELARQLSGLKINEEMIKEAMRKLNLSERATEWTDTQLLEFVRLIRFLSKPIIIVANKSDLPSSQANIEKLRKEFPNMLIIPCSAESELALREAAKHNFIDYIPGEKNFKASNKLSREQTAALEFIKKNVLEKYNSTGVQETLNTAVFSFLRYVVAYPVENEHHLSDKDGNVLPDAFLMPPNSKAIDLAYAIHTEIGNSFIVAIDARTKKRLARDYILKDKDVVRIMTR